MGADAWPAKQPSQRTAISYFDNSAVRPHPLHNSDRWLDQLDGICA